MFSPELMRRVRELEISAHRLLKGTTPGENRTTKRGLGFEFHELRDYSVGDDVRFIDWKASARSTDLLVRSYKEDNNRTIVVIVDSSASMRYSSHAVLNSTVAAEVGALIALAAHAQKDAVGLVVHNEYLLPRANTGHVMRLMKKLLQESLPDQTMDWQILERIAKNSLVIIVSDFITIDQTLLRRIAQRHETIAIRIVDPLEASFDNDTLLMLQDPETHQQVTCWSPQQLRALKNTVSTWRDEQNVFFKQARITFFDILTHTHYIDQLIMFFNYYRSV